jgi:hypothetical protein
MRVKFINEPVSIETSPLRDGTSRPLAFVWRGHRYLIKSWGRESTRVTDSGILHCHLVQTRGPQTWELCQDRNSAQWTLVRHWAGNDPIA